MSEQGWRAFLASDVVADWVVLHGGATAVFRTGSLRASARLAAAVAELPGTGGALLTATDDALTVRLTRGVLALEVHHVEVARTVSDVARAHGADADRAAAQEVQVAVAAQPDARDVGFWRAVLGYGALSDDAAVDPLGHGSTVWVQDLDPSRPLRHAMHVDVSVAREHAQARVDAALSAGGRIVRDDEAPGWWVLSDRAGNRVCVASWPDGAPGAS